MVDAWFIDTPVPCSGDEWAFWCLLSGGPLSGIDLEPWQSHIKRPSQHLRFSFAGFDIPLVNPSVANFLANDVPDAVPLPPLALPKTQSGHRILVATHAVRCVDEANSEFTTWGEGDGRPDKVGKYRMFSRLRLDPAAVPAETHIFCVLGWQIALIASAWLAAKLRNIVGEGLAYDEVA